ncbi:hypothetical protein [Lentilactobacillus senioris]|uniref:hypothetical protein n=1 Tax=Lentilactobacillus senioris TaxID=931534 RepID=UPI003D2DE20B
MKKTTTIALVVAGLTIGIHTAATTTHASVKLANGYLNETTVFNHGYVTTKKTIKTNLYRNLNGKKVRYTIPKGSTLSVATVGYTENHGQIKTNISLNLSNTSYTFKKTFSDFNAHHGYWLKTDSMALKKDTFKLANTQNKLGGLTFEAGTGVKNLTSKTATPMFTVTDNGYLQYYSSAKIKHAKQLDGGWNFAIANVKPTNTRKIIKVRRAKNVTYLYYAKPINGLKEYKIKSGLYRLKINHMIGQNRTQKFETGEEVISLTWANYYVGGKRFYVVQEY